MRFVYWFLVAATILCGLWCALMLLGLTMTTADYLVVTVRIRLEEEIGWERAGDFVRDIVGPVNKRLQSTCLWVGAPLLALNVAWCAFAGWLIERRAAAPVHVATADPKPSARDDLPA